MSQGSSSRGDGQDPNRRAFRLPELTLPDRLPLDRLDDRRALQKLLEETLVVWMGEFGRTPRVMNTKQFGPDGRDHWPLCYTVLFAGGGTIPGAVFGSSDRTGAYPATDPVTADDIAANHVLGSGHRPVHRGARQPQPAPAHRGRPADHGDFLMILARAVRLRSNDAH